MKMSFGNGKKHFHISKDQVKTKSQTNISFRETNIDGEMEWLGKVLIWFDPRSLKKIINKKYY